MQLKVSPSILVNLSQNPPFMAVIVIRAAPEHGEVIARFNQAMAMETENKVLEHDVILPGVMTMLQDDSLGFYLVALRDHSVVGSLGVTYEWSDWRNGLFWWIQSVYVPTEHRTGGVFSSMYKTVKTLAKADSRSCGIRLYVEKKNDKAFNTYTGLGMQETEYRLMEDLL